MTLTRLKPLAIPACLSLVLHLLILLTFAQLWEQLAQFSTTPEKAQENKPIKVTTMSQEELRKFRTVGVKNGAKDFSAPVKNPPKKISAPPKESGTKSTMLGQLGQVDTKEIQKPSPQATIKPQAKATPDASGLRLMGDSQAPVEVRTARTQDRYQSLRNMGVADDDAKKLAQTDFDVNFVPPEGVSEDELNSAEKMYYSFQKRTFESYVTSFLSTYNQMSRTLPRLRDPLMTERHFLTARVIFDQDGNIMSLRILRSSPNDDIHQLFERTLRNIRKVPNPPKDLLAKDGTFTIYYQLRVN